MKQSVFLSLAVLVVVLAAACTQAQPATPANQAPPTAAAQKQSDWQKDWDTTLAAAKQEGKLVAITSFGGESNSALAKAFKDKYGLDMEFVVGKATEIDTKINNERRAGMYLEDIYMAGISSLLPTKDSGYVDSLKPLLILPEATDSKAWLGGGLNYYDKEGQLLSYIVQVGQPVEINTDIVKEEQIQSYRDLLDPKWKGKITVMDPTIGSSGTFFFSIVWTLMGPDYVRELGKQDLAITPDARQAAEWLARGKYPVAGSISISALAEMSKAGAPIKVVIPKEGTLTTAATGGIGVMNKAPNPNATKIFVNWLLSKEGQTVMSQIFRAPSRRMDISYGWVDPAYLIKPGMNYVDSETEQMLRLRLELQKTSADIWNVKK